MSSVNNLPGVGTLIIMFIYSKQFKYFPSSKFGIFAIPIPIYFSNIIDLNIKL